MHLTLTEGDRESTMGIRVLEDMWWRAGGDSFPLGAEHATPRDLVLNSCVADKAVFQLP